MSQALAVDQIVKLRVCCYDVESDQLGENVTHWKVTSAAGGVTDLDFATNRLAAHSLAYRGWMSSRSTYAGVIVKIIYPSSYPEVKVSSPPAAGTAGAEQLPTQVSGLIRLQTNTVADGSGGGTYNPKGRIYPPFPSSMWATEQGQMNTGGYDQLTAIQGTYPLVVNVTGPGVSASLKLMLRSPGIPVAYYDVVTLSHPQKFATQRRRGDFGKANANPF